MDRLDCDRMFIAVLEARSFAGAAERLGVSAGQASKLITRLEAELGVRLLHRTTRALSATEAGQAYYEGIKELIDAFDALDASVRQASGTAAGRVRMTVPITFGTLQLAPALVEFATAYPGIQIDAAFSDRVVSLVDEGFDLAVRIGQPGDTSLIARRLCDMRVVLVASPAYLRHRGSPARPQDLATHDCIIDTNFREPQLWRFRDGAQGLSVAVQGRIRFSNAEACLAAALAGHGIARIPSFIAGPQILAGGVTPVLSTFEDVPLSVHVLYPPGRHLALKVRKLVDFLVARYRGSPPWDQGW